MLRIYICETAREDQEVIAQALRERVGSAAVVVDRRQRPVVAGMADRDRSRGHAGLRRGRRVRDAAGARRMRRAGLSRQGARRRPFFRYARNPAVRAGRSWRDFTSATTLPAAAPIRPAAAPACGAHMVRHVPFRAGHDAPAVQRPLQRRRARCWKAPARYAHRPPGRRFLEAPQGHVLAVSRSAMQSCSRRSSGGRRAVTRQISGRGAEDAAVRRQRIGHQRGAAHLADAPLRPSRRWTAAADRRTASGLPFALRWRNCAIRPAMWRCPKPSGATPQMAGHHAGRPASSSARSLISLLICVARRASRRPRRSGGATAGTVHQAHAQPLFQR